MYWMKPLYSEHKLLRVLFSLHWSNDRSFAGTDLEQYLPKNFGLPENSPFLEKSPPHTAKATPKPKPQSVRTNIMKVIFFNPLLCSSLILTSNFIWITWWWNKKHQFHTIFRGSLKANQNNTFKSNEPLISTMIRSTKQYFFSCEHCLSKYLRSLSQTHVFVIA